MPSLYDNPRQDITKSLLQQQAGRAQQNIPSGPPPRYAGGFPSAPAPAATPPMPPPGLGMAPGLGGALPPGLQSGQGSPPWMPTPTTPAAGGMPLPSSSTMPMNAPQFIGSQPPFMGMGGTAAPQQNPFSPPGWGNKNSDPGWGAK